MGVSIEKTNRLLVTGIDTIKVFNVQNYQEVHEEMIKVDLLPAKDDEREPNQIISLAVSFNEKHLAVITGKNLIKN